MPTILDQDRAGVSLCRADISESLFAAANDALAAGIDIETTGLSWSEDRIATVQVAVPEGPIEIVRIEPEERPTVLAALLESSSVSKVFHHAMFDLRFMRAVWGMRCERAACTKIAAKLADPTGEIGHSLVDLLHHYLGVNLDKSEQTSNWMAEDLSSSQLRYAADDVRYLVPLLNTLLNDLRHSSLDGLAIHCFDHLPTRVELEVRGFADVYTY